MDPAERTREEGLRGRLEEWSAAHPNATFAEMEQAVEEQLDVLRAELTQQVVDIAAAREGKGRGNATCPECGRKLESQGYKEREVALRGKGTVRLRRRRQGCPACGAGFFPLDQQLALARTEFSPWLVETIVRLGTLLPFDQVPSLVEHLAGAHVGRETVRVLTEKAGAALVEVEAAEREAHVRALPTPLAAPALQQLSVDGAMVPLVGGQWTEAKTLAVGEVELLKGEPHAKRLSYFSRVCPAEDFVPALYPELHRRGTERAGTVCAVNDGADWTQRVADAYRPDAVRILDFPHAAEHVATVGRLVFGMGSAPFSEWLGVQLHTLRHGDPDEVLTALRELSLETAADPSGAELIRTQEVAYFEKRRAQINYAQFRAAGYPIGSGAVESANKVVVEARMKGAGMHWAPANVNPLLALRATHASGRWTERWPEIRRRLLQREHERHRRRWTARHRDTPCTPSVEPRQAPVTPAPTAPRPRVPTGHMLNGKPTSTHPWHRGALSRPSIQKS